MRARTRWTFVAGLLAIATVFGTSSACAGSPPPGPRTVHIKVTDEGYAPARIEVKAGETIRLAFDSETDSECQGTVKSTDLGIEPTRLPKDKTTVIEVAPKKAGEYTFACAMDMISGTLIVEAP